MNIYTTLVARGVKLLNREGPKRWFLRVNLNRLDINSKCNCVLGQAFGDFLVGKYRLGLKEDEVSTHGFQALPPQEVGEFTPAWREAREEQYAALTGEWCVAILKLRAEWRHA